MNLIEKLRAQHNEFCAKTIEADACVTAAIEAWTDLAALLLEDKAPTADQRFGASFVTQNAQRQLRELADRLGELGGAYDRMLAAAAGERSQ